MRVVHFHRKPTPSQFSVERYFDAVRAGFPKELDVTFRLVPCYSRGFFRRLTNIVFTVFAQGDVNHVTGDINYVACFLASRKTIVTVLDCQVLERLTGWRRTLVRVLWFSLPGRRAKWITVISQATKDALVRETGLPQDKIKVIPVAVNSAFSPSAKEWSIDVPRILQIGTKANKNVTRLVDALSGIPCILEIVGPLDSKLADHLRSSNVRFSQSEGLSDAEIHRKYIDCDIVAFVSTYEGFGMPIVEAQCIERAVVTSNCSSMPEVAGEGACFVDPFDASSIREGILKVINDAQFREDIIAKGRINRERFQPETIAKLFENLYRMVVDR